MRERRALRSSLAPKCNIFVRQLHGMLHKCLPENKPDNPGFGTSKNPGFSGFEKRRVTRVPKNPGLPTLLAAAFSLDLAHRNVD